MRSLLLLPLLSLLAGCHTGSVDEDDFSTTSSTGTPPPTTSTTSTSTSAPSTWGPAWTLQDDTPYARVGHVTVLDEAEDRMILFGGGANDTWQLPLSGAAAGVWSQLVVPGEHPTLHTYGGSMYADSAVYDPAGQRMIVLLNPLPSTADSLAEVELWELSLGDMPAWRHLQTQGPSPGAEIQSGRIVLDREGNRLFAVGGALDETGVWQLTLEDPPTWSRFADTPDQPIGPFYVDSSLVLDAERNQLVLFGGHPRLGAIHALSLEDKQWTKLYDDDYQPSAGYGVATTLDAAGDRLVLIGGDVNTGIALFSLETLTWEHVELGPISASHRGSSAVADPSRGRVVYFSGQVETKTDNTTWVFDLDELTRSELVPATRTTDFEMGQRAAVWDEARGAVIAFGDYQGGDTWSHGLAPADSWEPISAGTTPSVAFTTGIFDPVGGAIVAFGGYQYKETDALVRLASTPGATWETLTFTGGPSARLRHAAVHDTTAGRMIVHGGWRNVNAQVSEVLGDVWSFDLAASTWTELAPTGKAPVPRMQHAAVYDPEGRRMVLFGGHDYLGTTFTDTWSLSLEGAPAWTQLAPGGVLPGATTSPSAVYDPEGKRMIVVDLADGDVQVHALDLSGEPEWHRFCWSGLTPASSWNFPGTTPNVVLAGGALFLTVSGGAFRFDLGASYCD